MARILLADDDAATRDLVSRALLSDGHDVDVVSDGQEALDALRRSPTDCDLLITDVEMPALDGVALATAARGLRPDLRIVLMSGFESSLGRAGDIAGAKIAVVLKPFTLEKIRSEVRAALG